MPFYRGAPVPPKERAMASGFGIHGGKRRCYDVWMEFSECMSRCTVPADCAAAREDYFECLHQRKEWLRLNAINKQRDIQAAAAAAAEKGGSAESAPH